MSSVFYTLFLFGLAFLQQLFLETGRQADSIAGTKNEEREPLEIIYGWAPAFIYLSVT